MNALYDLTPFLKEEGKEEISDIDMISFLVCLPYEDKDKMTEYLVKKQESIVVTRGIDGLDKAKKSIEKDMKQKADEASVEAYDILSRLYYDGNVNITEAEANELYKKTVLKLIKDKYKMTGSEEDANYSLISSLKSVVPKLEVGEITIVDNIQPYFELDGNRILERYCAL